MILFKVFLPFLFIISVHATNPFSTVDDAVKGLSSDSYKIRKAAKMYLWSHYPTTSEPLIKASESDDPEVSASAKEVLARVAKGDIPESVYLTALQYARGKMSNEKVLMSFNKRADKGDPLAKMWLARIYFRGRCGVKADTEKGQSIAKEVIDQVIHKAENSDFTAFFLLGSAYSEGLGVKIDLEESVKWYQKGVEHNDILALNNLALMMLLAQGTKPNHELAMKYLRKASKQGSFLSGRSLKKYSKNHDFTEINRLTLIRKHPLGKLLGMSIENAIKYLNENKFITQPNSFEKSEKQYDEFLAHLYKFHDDGIQLSVNSTNSRVTSFEVYKGGFKKFKKFKHTLPLEMKWGDNSEDAREKIGSPTESGSVATDQAFGMAYKTQNVYVSVMFEIDDETDLKIFRVYEKWAENYSALDD